MHTVISGHAFKSLYIVSASGNMCLHSLIHIQREIHMVKFMKNKREVNVLVKQLKAGGFTVTDRDGWVKALDDDGTEVMMAMPHSNRSYMLKLNDNYFA